MSDLKRLAIDVYQGKTVKFNDVSGEDALRNMLNEAVGGEFNYKNFRENKYRVFSIIEEAVDAVLGVVITNQFDSLAETKNIGLGDKFVFTVKDNSLFRVARIGAGNNDLRRQKLQSNNFTVDTAKYGVKIYEELDQFLAGRVDWAGLVNRVAQSFSVFMGTKIYEAFANSYTSLNKTYGVDGVYDEEKLFDLVQHVEAKSGKVAQVYGTKKALRKISKDIDKSDALKDKMNAVGYIDTVAGTDLYLLPQAHNFGTDNFMIDDNMLLVIPAGEKIVKVIVEGESTMLETADAGARNDQQMEYSLQKAFGVGVMQSAIYGIYKFDK